ncbi:MAG: hypothetical protein AAGA50_02245 [Pseudomonadota bacterium]
MPPTTEELDAAALDTEIRVIVSNEDNILIDNSLADWEMMKQGQGFAMMTADPADDAGSTQFGN